MLFPLLVMAVAFTLLFLTLHVAAMRNEILRRRVRALMLMQAQAARERADVMNLGPHADFIVAAYGVAVLVVAALIGWVVLDYGRSGAGSPTSRRAASRAARSARTAA